MGLDTPGCITQQCRARRSLLGVGIGLDQQKRGPRPQVSIELLGLPPQGPMMKPEQGPRILLGGG